MLESSHRNAFLITIKLESSPDLNSEVKSEIREFILRELMGELPKPDQLEVTISDLNKTRLQILKKIDLLKSQVSEQVNFDCL
jgi:hypothetical protein